MIETMMQYLVHDDLQGNSHAHTGSPHGTLLHNMWCCTNLVRDKYSATCTLLHGIYRYWYQPP